MKYNWIALFVPLFFAILARPVSATEIKFVDAPSADTVEVELAISTAEMMRGLMFRASMPENHGMFFLFENDAPRGFWMKNVGFPLDIIFVDKDMVIEKIWRRVPPCKSDPCPDYKSGAPARFVLEVNGGFCENRGIKEKQRIEYIP